jgi:hypothetical protein
LAKAAVGKNPAMFTLLLVLAALALVCYFVFARKSVFRGRGPISGRWGRRY